MLEPRRSLCFAVSLFLWACSADEYAPCSGESGSCSESTRNGGDFEGCLCTYYCESDDDCPTPDTGTAKPRCRPFGDFEINGESAACFLPCDQTTRCPDGMFCRGGECWGTVGR